MSGRLLQDYPAGCPQQPRNRDSGWLSLLLTLPVPVPGDSRHDDQTSFSGFLHHTPGLIIDAQDKYQILVFAFLKFSELPLWRNHRAPGHPDHWTKRPHQAALLTLHWPVFLLAPPSPCSHAEPAYAEYCVLCQSHKQQHETLWLLRLLLDLFPDPRHYLSTNRFQT